MEVLQLTTPIAKRALEQHKVLISQDLISILKEITNEGVDEETKIGYNKWAQSAHADELIELGKGLSTQGEQEVLTFNTFMRNHFRYGHAEDLFVIIDKNELYKLVGTLTDAKDFFTEVGFPSIYIDQIIEKYPNAKPDALFEIGIKISIRDGLPELYLRPNIGTENSSIRPSIIYPESLHTKEGIAIIKKAYSRYNTDYLFFDIKMLAKENLNSDDDE